MTLRSASLSGGESDKVTAPIRWRPLFHIAIFFVLFGVPLFFIHLPLLHLPYFWDEHGQFIPTALDLLRDGSWVAHSTSPNIHPPGVEAYLVVWYRIFGYSIPVTRLAMLALAAAGLLILFLLAVELTRASKGTPAFLPPLLLLVSPIFFTQSMMAQLDLPAMVFTLLALLLFLREQHFAASIACVALVLSKETGLVTPVVFFGFLIWRRQYRSAVYYVAAPVALAIWLAVLHHSTGYWMGNPGFEHYNVGYSLQPVRIVFTALRRIYYLLFAEFRWVGTLAIALTARTLWKYWSDKWLVTALVFGINLTLVTLFGGAALERYLLPVLPLYYLVVSLALIALPRSRRLIGIAALLIGLVANIFWNPPYPFPYENNFAMVDFVRLQAIAAGVIESQFPHSTVATAWPFTAALKNPDYGYVEKPVRAIETNDFHFSSIEAVPPGTFDTLIVYTRVWAPREGVLQIPFVRHFLERYYDYEPPVDEAQCARLGLAPVVSWNRRGQEITVYRRTGMPENVRAAASSLHAADKPKSRNRK